MIKPVLEAVGRILDDAMSATTMEVSKAYISSAKSLVDVLVEDKIKGLPNTVNALEPLTDLSAIQEALKVIKAPTTAVKIIAVIPNTKAFTGTNSSLRT